MRQLSAVMYWMHQRYHSYLLQLLEPLHPKNMEVAKMEFFILHSSLVYYLSRVQENICLLSIFFTFLVSLLADKYAARVFNGNKSAGLPELISSRTIPYFLSARYARYRKISLSTARSGSEINLDGFCYQNFERDPYREFYRFTKKYLCFLPEVRNFCASLIQDW